MMLTEGSKAPDFSLSDQHGNTVSLADFAGKKIFLTHGADLGVKYSIGPAVSEARKFGADILLYGHTHIAYVGYEDGLYIMNPGSCARPRKGAPSYGVIDITKAGIHMHTVEI